MKPRRTFSAEFKAQVVLEVLSGTKLFETNATANPEQARIAELERMVERLALQLEVAKKPPVA